MDNPEQGPAVAPVEATTNSFLRIDPSPMAIPYLSASLAGVLGLLLIGPFLVSRRLQRRLLG